MNAPLRLSAFAAAAALLAGAFALTPAAAVSRGEVVTAVVSEPFAARERIIAANLVWNCEGEACVAAAERAVNVRTCRRLAREAGPVSAFSSESAALTEEQIVACNEAARPRA